MTLPTWYSERWFLNSFLCPHSPLNYNLYLIENAKTKIIKPGQGSLDAVLTLLLLTERHWEISLGNCGFSLMIRNTHLGKFVLFQLFSNYKLYAAVLFWMGYLSRVTQKANTVSVFIERFEQLLVIIVLLPQWSQLKTWKVIMFNFLLL